MPMTQNDIARGIPRLAQLARELAKEVSILRSGGDPLLAAEGRAYLTGIHDALAGVEAARVVLAAVMERFELQALQFKARQAQEAAKRASGS
jgi:hypothetical protein